MLKVNEVGWDDACGKSVTGKHLIIFLNMFLFDHFSCAYGVTLSRNVISAVVPQYKSSDLSKEG